MNNARLSAQYCFVTFPYSPHPMRVGSLPVLSNERVARNGAVRSSGSTCE